MVDQAVATLERMNTLPGGEAIRMNVNVSRRELVHPQFLSNVRDVIARMTVEPARLRFEITETAVSGSASIPCLGGCRELKDLGVDILLDDFGAGLSSLSLLRAPALDGIKIDRAFIRALDGRRAGHHHPERDHLARAQPERPSPWKAWPNPRR